MWRGGHVEMRCGDTEMWRSGYRERWRQKHERWRSEEVERWTGRQMERRRVGETGREGVGEVGRSSRPCRAACRLCLFASCPPASASPGRALCRHFFYCRKHGSSGVHHTGTVLGQGQDTVGWCQAGADRRAILAVAEWGACSRAACSNQKQRWVLAPCSPSSSVFP